MGLLIRMLSTAADDDYTLARDLIAMAYADGKITDEEREAIARICHMEDISEEKFSEILYQSESAHSPIPVTDREKEDYLVKMIQVMGADGDSSSEEIFLLEMMADRLGFNKFRLMSTVLLHATHRYFPKDYGARVLDTFMRNIIDVRGKNDRQNHDNLAKLYDAVAAATPSSPDEEENKELLRASLASATKVLLGNRIQRDEFRKAGLDFKAFLEYEEQKAYQKWINY